MHGVEDSLINMAAATLPRPDKPTENNDYFEIGHDGQTFALFDGRSPQGFRPPIKRNYTYRAGARLAPHILEELCEFSPTTEAEASGILRAQLVTADQILKESSTTQELQTTATIGAIRRSSAFPLMDVWIASVGDSPVYRWRASENRVNVWSLESTGAYSDVIASGDELMHLARQTRFAQISSPSQLRENERKHWGHRSDLLTWLGAQASISSDSVAFSHQVLVPGDIMFALTDGGSRNLTLDEMADLINESNQDALSVARILVQAAAKNSVDPNREIRSLDDITAVVAAYPAA